MPLVLAFAAPAVAQNPKFKGCGPTEDRAREELAKNISSEIDSEWVEIETTDGKLEGRQIRSELNVRTQLRLAAVDIERISDTEVCAYQTREVLRDVFRTALDVVLDNCDPDKLDASLSTCRKKAITAKMLYPLFKRETKRKELSTLYSRSRKIEDEAKKQLHQALTFSFDARNPYDLSRAYAVVNELPRTLGQKIPLPAGEVNWVIQVPGYCPISGKTNLPSGREESPKVSDEKINLDDYNYPVVIFKSDADNANLYVDGKLTGLNESVVIRRCDGVLPYYLKVPDQKVDGEIKLRPGLNTTESIVVSDFDRLRKIAEAWATKPSIQVRYGGGVPLRADFENPDWIQTIQLEYLAAFNPIRIGGGVLYGYGTSRDHQIEAYAKLIAQITSFGEYPAHIGSSLAFIPYLGIEAGLGYHGHRPTDTRKRGDFGSIEENIVVFRVVAGTSFTLNEVFSLIAEYNAALLTHERRMGVNVGLAFLF